MGVPEMNTDATRPGSPAEPAVGPLHGLRVIEVAAMGPVPFCGMLLADLGAEVLRVDRTADAGLGIALDPRFELRGRGKQSVAMDLKHPDGLAAFLRLVARADVLLEGFRPGVAERLGIGPRACLSLRPSLVYGRATGWGQSGPMSQAAGHDINYLALTGALDMIGPAGGAPVPPLNLVGDYAGGALYLALGVVSAGLEAARSGVGQVVDAAMIDGVSSLLTVFHGFRQAGMLNPERGANVLDGGAPYYTTYATLDGRHMAVGAIEPKFFAVLLSELGLDQRELPAQQDRARWPQLRQAIAARFAQRTRDDWAAHFQDKDACVSPVLALHEAPQHAHNQARAQMVDVDGIEHPAPAPRFSRTPASIRGNAAAPGAHTVQALESWGFDAAEIERGLSAGFFRSDP
ncbi:CaiB/BaiF CoA transferase family protein [Bordetella bronchiseptica]|uniref:Racemase n=2 Tax=Bordetella bronchiseptica TaxID=518 RepID=A0A0H3LM93_BORBR|nr:CaiB/BaiF CoA-transferase family protein [Bordetella bronchiseptica]KCV29834.1 CoA-transferase family III protein [Bordetella bronchiseptica 00-P-2730]AMG87105.2 carnitine dehydratase [Bordetella bronchiseptica]KCV48654.1 CoA-transferase family III protein [Bordetella bronchiseptica 3E44]KDC46837.1 CoA-transferase family III protein [Bordetella bronchiseptica M85/00/2]KDC63265.1 CoA-transferase family III protein [Bordetella bronchiseptica MBORD595]